MPLYIPPIKFQIGGNTSGASTQIVSGVLTFAGGNNITLSQAGNAITISGGAGGGGVAVAGNIAGNFAGVSEIVTSGTIYLAGGNNLTISQNNNSFTFSAGAGGGGAAVGVGTVGNTAGTSGTFSSGTVFFAGGNNITASQSTGPSGATLSIVGASHMVNGISTGGNTAGTTGFVSVGSYLFVGGNNVTLSQSTGANGATVPENLRKSGLSN